MLESDKLALAAHLHVVMRRKIGRVIDVEWVVRNADYAREVLRVARLAEDHADVQEWADKLQAALFPAPPAPPAPAARREPATGPRMPEIRRYIGSLR